MSEVTRRLMARVGVDIAKQVIHVHAVDAAGRRVLARALKRDQFLPWCAQHLPPGCVVAMAACSGAHHWGRRLMGMGFAARRIAPHLRRTNRIRGVLAEFGLVFGKSPKVLRAAQPDVLEDASNEISGTARMALQQAFDHWRGLDDCMQWCDCQTLLPQGAKSAVMSVDKRDDPTSRWLKQLIDRVGWQKACVAMANENARILWAVMTREQGFDAQHVSAKPAAKQKPPVPTPELAPA